ncbi:HET-domain-containing protein [Annulohypoxylon nitens]|nr:HET-domain-containing protein [Annulohypoxylon nitens]
MRLLNCRTLKMKEFFDDYLPPYIILSHTWDDGEVSYQDFQSRFRRRRKRGFRKIKGFCAKATSMGYDWVWVDTCCIDKASSSELFEAINSMFQWYERSSKCFVYLSDVDNLLNKSEGLDSGSLINDVSNSDDSSFARESSFRESRWFTRGWTLQELLAPSQVFFYDMSWREIGSKISLWKIISEVTNIPRPYLLGHKNLKSAPSAQRISWASNRKTSRIEDMAYCLLGLLNVNMPLLYGEGNKAFIRLQNEIMHHTYDHSILASGLNLPCPDPGDVLNSTYGEGYLDFASKAPPCLPESADAFRAWEPGVMNIEGIDHYFLTNLGIDISLGVIPFEFNKKEYGLALLHCRASDSKSPRYVALPLSLYRPESQIDGKAKSRVPATRPYGITPFLMPRPDECSIRPMQIYLSSKGPSEQLSSLTFRLWTYEIRLESLCKIGYYLADFFPPCLAKIDHNKLIIQDSSACPRIFRLCHRIHETILLLFDWNDHTKSFFEIRVKTTRDTFTSWQLVLPGLVSGGGDFGLLLCSWPWIQLERLKRPPFTTGQFCDFVGEINLDLDQIKALPLRPIDFLRGPLAYMNGCQNTHELEGHQTNKSDRYSWQPNDLYELDGSSIHAPESIPAHESGHDVAHTIGYSEPSELVGSIIEPVEMPAVFEDESLTKLVQDSVRDSSDNELTKPRVDTLDGG